MVEAYNPESEINKKKSFNEKKALEKSFNNYLRRLVYFTNLMQQSIKLAMIQNSKEKEEEELNEILKKEGEDLKKIIKKGDKYAFELSLKIASSHLKEMDNIYEKSLDYSKELSETQNLISNASNNAVILSNLIVNNEKSIIDVSKKIKECEKNIASATNETAMLKAIDNRSVLAQTRVDLRRKNWVLKGQEKYNSEIIKTLNRIKNLQSEATQCKSQRELLVVNQNIRDLSKKLYHLRKEYKNQNKIAKYNKHKDQLNNAKHGMSHKKFGLVLAAHQNSKMRDQAIKLKELEDKNKPVLTKKQKDAIEIEDLLKKLYTHVSFVMEKEVIRIDAVYERKNISEKEYIKIYKKIIDNNNYYLEKIKNLKLKSPEMTLSEFKEKREYIMDEVKQRRNDLFKIEKVEKSKFINPIKKIQKQTNVKDKKMNKSNRKIKTRTYDNLNRKSKTNISLPTKKIQSKTRKLQSKKKSGPGL